MLWHSGVDTGSVLPVSTTAASGEWVLCEGEGWGPWWGPEGAESTQQPGTGLEGVSESQQLPGRVGCRGGM